jgi:hypothetical protein
MHSQLLLLFLEPAAAVLVSLLIVKRSEKRLALLAAGLWLSTIGTFAITFPKWAPYSNGQLGGFGWTDTTKYLASLGVFGSVIVMLALIILAISSLKKAEPIED